MKTWRCPIDGSYVKNDDKCPKCHLTWKQADEKMQLDADRDHQYDNIQELKWLEEEGNSANI